MKTLIDHLAQYADYHRDPRNIHTHFVGVPMIMFAVVILLSRPTWMVGAVPVSPALLAALAASVFYIVEGLGCGADDFMTKPVRIGELRARVAALLRRSYTDKTEEVLEFGRYRFLPESRSLEIEGTPVELKNREYELALFLFQNMGQLLTRDHLKEVIWGQVPDVMSRSLDTHISRLRILLDLRPANGFIVTSVYGVGYRFETTEQVQPA